MAAERDLQTSSSFVGDQIYALAQDLWPLNRSLTGAGVRETLRRLKTFLPNLATHEIPSGTQVFDWVIPKEWNVRSARLTGPNEEKIVDFADHNLHLVGYSVPVDRTLDLSELQTHLYSLPEQPDAIPYVTSYYAERWGFCLPHTQKQNLKPGTYHAHIDADLKDGALTYGELVIKGDTQDEVLLSTYICHPSMANNELSGPCVATYLARWIAARAHRRYTYRFVFIPETIGSIAYVSRNFSHLKAHVKAGFNISCVGDDRAYSYLPSRHGDTLSDQVAQHVLKWIDPHYVSYTWKDRGSDERQYCAPGIDLPIASIMRTKYGAYPEYHTSLDTLGGVVTPEGLYGAYEVLCKSLEVIENNVYPQTTVLGEPQLGKRGLYPTISTKGSADHVALMMDFISYADGKTSLLDIAEKCDAPIWRLYPIFESLRAQNLMVSHLRPV